MWWRAIGALGCALATAIPAAAAAASPPHGWPCPAWGEPVAAFASGTGGASEVLDPTVDYVGPTDVAPPPPVAGPVEKNMDVYVHVITGSDGVTGFVDPARIALQMQQLNAAFAGHATFTMPEPADYTANDAWYTMEIGSAEEREAKAALREGDSASDLNFYIAGLQLSWGTFPWWYEKDPERDGIVVNEPWIAGFGSVGPREGDVAIHEVGHWLGLFHTFQGGCNKKNDGVDDTPAEKSPGFGCEAGRDTCRTPGLDPIHNFMDYSTEACRTEFTAGQQARMDSMWVAYRQSG